MGCGGGLLPGQTARGRALCRLLYSDDASFEAPEEQLQVPGEDSAHDLGSGFDVTSLYAGR
jgi:hypothetical protein